MGAKRHKFGSYKNEKIFVIMKIRFNNLSLATSQVDKKFILETKKFLRKNHFILGEEVAEFEVLWAKYCGIKYSVGVSNGSDAIYLALLALGVGEGDEVITQGNAYNASVVSILRTGAVPRFVDINPNILTIDVSKIEKLINKKTKAILPVHLYGQMNDMESILKITKKHNLKVVEDCAQAHLAEFNGKKAGTWGDAGAFSFYPTKNLGAFGDAGAVVTNDKKIYENILALRDLGQTAKNRHEYFGFNMRMDSIQALFLKLKMPFLRGNTKKRQNSAKIYDQLLKKANISVVPILNIPNSQNVYHLYVVRSLYEDRETITHKLKEFGIETAIHYPIPVYHQPFFVSIKNKVFNPCPITDEISRQIFSLPLFLGITKKEQKYVVEKLKEILN